MSCPLLSLEIVEVLELSHYLEVNQYLQVGWHLLNSYIVQLQGEQQVRYVLGWSKREGVPRLPEAVQARQQTLASFDFS